MGVYIPANTIVLPLIRQGSALNMVPGSFITDDEARSLELDDAQCVIHYDPAESPQDFENRLWFMKKNFVNPFETPETPVPNCVSYILVTEDYSGATFTIHALKRSGSEVPECLNHQARRNAERKEHGRAQLCPYFKAFGKCRDQARCIHRHVVYENVDVEAPATHNPLPRQGNVKILVTHVQNASCFWARLLEHQPPGGGTWQKLHTVGGMLTMDMALWYHKAENRKLAYIIPKKEELYVWRESSNNTFHRVWLIDLLDKELSGLFKTAEVLFVDTGKREFVPREELMELADQFKDIPYQAIEVFVCRVKPVDNDTEWTNLGSLQMAEAIDGKESGDKTLEGTIVLNLGITLWLDPLVRRSYLRPLRTDTIEFNVRQQILDQGVGVENPEHVPLLYEACSKLSLPDFTRPEDSPRKAYTYHGQLTTPDVNTLPMPEPGVETMTDVFVSALEHPDLVYVQLAKDEERLQDLNDEIEVYVKYQSTGEVPPKPLKLTTLVLAKFPLNDKWYRGKISEVLPDRNGYDVFFVDTGESEEVALNDVLALPGKYQHLPFQAIECSLVGLEPHGVGWSDQNGDTMWNITRFEDTPIRLKAKVYVRCSARYSGKYHYGIELWDTNHAYDINIGYHLVALGEAKLSSTCLEDMLKDCGNQKISDICGRLINELDGEKKTELALALLQEAQALDIIISPACCVGALQSVVYTLQCVAQPSVIPPLVSAVLMWSRFICSEPDHFDVQLLVNCLCRILAELESPDTVQAVVAAMHSLMKSNNFHKVVYERGGLVLVSKVLHRPDSPDKVLIQAIQIVLIIVEDLMENITRSVLTYITGSGCVEALCWQLKESQNGEVVLICLQTLDTLATPLVMKDYIRKHGGVKTLCEKISGWKNTQMLESGVKFLKNLANNSGFNKAVMNEYKLIDVLLKLKGREDLSPETRDVSEELYHRLCEMTPRESRGSPGRSQGPNTPTKGYSQNGHINHPRILDLNAAPLDSKQPTVKWSQSKWSVLLNVDANGIRARNGEQVVLFTEDSVSFRGVAERMEYSFSIKLYEVVVPEQCQYVIKSSQVFIGLKKKYRGVWPRVNKEKHKLVYVVTDIDRLYDESDEDDDETEEDRLGGDEKPLDLVKRNSSRTIPFSNADPLTPGVTCGMPQLEDSPSEGSDFDSDPPDQSYEHSEQARRLGFHTV